MCWRIICVSHQVKWNAAWLMFCVEQCMALENYAYTICCYTIALLETNRSVKEYIYIYRSVIHIQCTINGGYMRLFCRLSESTFI